MENKHNVIILATGTSINGHLRIKDINVLMVPKYRHSYFHKTLGTSEERTTSLYAWPIPMCHPLYGGSTVNTWGDNCYSIIVL